MRREKTKCHTRKSSFGFPKTLRAKQRMSNRRKVSEKTNETSTTLISDKKRLISTAAELIQPKKVHCLKTLSESLEVARKSSLEPSILAKVLDNLFLDNIQTDYKFNNH